MPNREREKGFQGEIKTEYINSTPWWPELTKAPEGAPNVLIFLMDDTGFADFGCYGAGIETPNIDALAADGIRYRNFHVNAMCSPTRASLMSGMNHHMAGMGYLGDFDLGYEGYRGCVYSDCGMISETLVENGYNTFMVGKWHLVNGSMMSNAGPYDEWPLARGFDKYYGFLGACTNQFYPQLVNGNEYVDAPRSGLDGYHLSEDLADHMIQYIADSKSYAPQKPFFGYFAFGAQHSPHQVPQEYIDKYKGCFDDGWAGYRKRIFEKQKALGIIPGNAELTIDDFYVQDWEALSPEEKKVMSKYMEVYAGFVSHSDAQVGRVVDFLKKIGEYDNTLIFCTTDNGASAEGGPWGYVNTMYHYYTEKYQDIVDAKTAGKLGTLHASQHYPISWANASDTPLKLYKSWSHNGGIKVPLVVTYPKGIKSRGEIRNQYHHVTDIFKTILDVCGVEEMKEIKGVKQQPKQGVSMSYTFDHPEEPTHKHVQYYEMIGNRAIWANGWKAVADHVANPSFDFSKDKWELYHTDEDFSEAHDLAEERPEKLQEMIDLWFAEAEKNHVLPMTESHMKKMEGFYSKNLYKFRPAKPRQHYTLWPGVTGNPLHMAHGSFVIKVFADYKKGDEGVLFSNGDNVGGYAMFIKDGKIRFHFNYLGMWHIETEAALDDLAEGSHEFTFDMVETKPNAEGLGRILIDGKDIGAHLFIKSEPMLVVHFGGMSLGRFAQVSVTDDALMEKRFFAYTNHIEKMTVDFDRPTDDMDMILEMERALMTE